MRKVTVCFLLYHERSGNARFQKPGFSIRMTDKACFTACRHGILSVTMSDITQILEQIEQGDPSAADQLLPLVYQELRKLAAQKLSKEAGGTSIQPTMLVHEAYVRLVDVNKPQKWNGRGHFFGAAAEAMRRILVEHARQKQSLKRGGDAQKVELNLEQIADKEPGEDILALDEALTELERQWPEKAELVKLKYFGGLTIPEASAAMGISTATAERYWRFARAWLHSQLKNRD